MLVVTKHPRNGDSMTFAVRSCKEKVQKYMLLHAVAFVCFAGLWAANWTPRVNFYNAQMALLSGYFGVMLVKYVGRFYGGDVEVVRVSDIGITVGASQLPWNLIRSVYVRRSDRPAFQEVCIESTSANQSLIVINEESIELSAEELAAKLNMCLIEFQSKS